MDIDTKFLEEIKFPEGKELFKIGMDMVINKNHLPEIRQQKYKTLSHEDKVKVTKIYDFLNKSAYAVKQKGDFGVEGLTAQLERLDAKMKGFIVEVIKMIE